MKAHEYQTIYSVLGEKKQSVSEFYARMLTLKNNSITETRELIGNTYSQGYTEWTWFSEGCPYYTVYPVAAASLAQVPMAVPCTSVKLPCRSILVRFIEGKEPEVFGKRLRCVLSGILNVGGMDGLCIWSDYGETYRDPHWDIDIPIFDYLLFPLKEGKTIEECIAEVPLHQAKEVGEDICGIPYAILPPDKDQPSMSREAARFVVGVSLLANDPELIKPDVLSKDRLKYDRNPDPAIVERAHRRGKKGWLVGADWEVMPHFRRPHFALRWTGKGRVTPKIVAVKGSIVHREILTEVPQGYMELENGK